MSRRWLPKRADGQTVTSSVLFGDVIQVSHVKGNVTISTDRPPYRIASAATPVPPGRDEAQAQPSRLLLPCHQIVPFTGQQPALAAMAEWISSAEAMAVRMIHAAGGQGKTRLALEVAAHCSSAGMTVWQVMHTPTPVPCSQVDLSSGAVLAIVDYADRWPFSSLLALLTQLHALSLHTPTVVRVLLLARSAGYWWPALAGRVDMDFGMPADEFPLPSVAADGDQRGLFTAAAGHFAAALGVEHADWQPPALDDSGFMQILAVHMAALAAVDAHRHGDHPPTQPHAVSAYLLRREYAHWQHLHGRLEDPLHTPPRAMHRSTFVATLTGPLLRPAAQDALVRAAVAADTPTADQIIDDYRFCHPPAGPDTAFEPLRPDRLGEDLIALSIPGHGHGGTGSLPDDWTFTAPMALLAKPGECTPTWAPAAVTVLIETARRWPHVATRILYPLLRQHPGLAITAGGTTLTRLASIPAIDPAVLEALEPLLPSGRDADLDTSVATITDVLTPHRLAATTDPAEHAHLHATHAWRLANAGRHLEALRATKAATEIYRRLADHDRTQYLPAFAESVNDLAISFAEAGYHGDALATAIEAATLYRTLVGLRLGDHRSGLASALATLANRLRDDGKLIEAITPAKESVDILRDLAGVDPDRYLPRLASILNNLANIYAETGNLRNAVPAIEEAVSIARAIYPANPAEHAPDLAMYLNNLANRLGDLGRQNDALPLAVESVAIRRPLAEANPAYIPSLAREIGNLANHLGNLGRPHEALPLAREAVELLQSLTRVGFTVHLPALAMSLNNLAVRLEDVDSFGDAVTYSRDSLNQYLFLSSSNPGQHIGPLGMVLSNLIRQLIKNGCRRESEMAFEDTVAVFSAATHRAYFYMLRCRDISSRTTTMRITDGATSLLLLSTERSGEWIAGEARKALRILRSADSVNFDHEWTSRHGLIPDWLLGEK
ncbi:tetratricopeptide repeat protein [Micromonospora rubida]